MTPRPDVTIVGGGPAGSALALVLGRRGVRVVLYEKARHPRLKACGEGLLPHGVAALERFAGLPRAPRVRGLRFVAGRHAVDTNFPDRPGLVVRRDRFDHWLFERAAETPNVEVRSGTPYRPEPTGMLVGADGVRSMFHRRFSARYRTPRRLGLSTHVAGLGGLSDRVEVYFHDEGELYVASTGDGEALVSALLDYRWARPDGLMFLLRKTPQLQARASRVQCTTPVLASAPLGLYVPRIVCEDGDGRTMLVGDAAGTPDPIAAGGLALALGATEAAANAIVSGDLPSYQRERLRLGRLADRLARSLLALSRSEQRAGFMLGRFRAIVPRLVEVAVRCPAGVGRPQPAAPRHV